MNIRFRKRFFSLEFLTGMLCMGAVAIIFYFTAMVSGRDFFFRHKDYTYTARFPNAGALAVNDKVKVIGVETGYVSNLMLSDDNSHVIVQMRLRRELRLPEDTEFTIQNSSVFGGAYVNIRPGVSKKIAPSDAVFTGFPPVDIISEASGLIAALKADEVKLRENMLNDEFLREVKDALRAVKMNADDVNLICRNIKEGKGSFGKLFNDDSLYNDAQNAFLKISRLLDEVNDGTGSLGKLVRDDRVYNELVTTLSDIRRAAAEMTSREHSLGLMTGDSGELYKSLLKSADSASGILSSIEQGRGSAGKFVSDDELYQELTEVVKELRSAIGEFRGMAPSAAFSSIALGAF